ncbi:MAG: CRISPR-associated protein Cas4 [Deltaproteobacteria bacterium]|nr:CRISPR-associated protein Cas4 [Deltaproteobacteria bacterium]MDZ4224644.1 CRISPR-associated protein Cas4 [bacterium]
MAQNDENSLVTLSSLEHYSFCPRQCGLIFVEGIWADDKNTVAGTLLHDHADTPGYETTDDGATILRALPLFSKKHGLVGKADIVEMRNGQPTPVEYKKGRKKQWGNDDIQLCAQALCLEEMFNAQIPKGYIYHATSKRRREVLLDEKLRAETFQTIEAVRKLLETGTVPPAVLAPKCDGCSLRKICMPELTGEKMEVAKKYEKTLWETHEQPH